MSENTLLAAATEIVRGARKQLILFVFTIVLGILIHLGASWMAFSMEHRFHEAQQHLDSLQNQLIEKRREWEYVQNNRDRWLKWQEEGFIGTDLRLDWFEVLTGIDVGDMPKPVIEMDPPVSIPRYPRAFIHKVKVEWKGVTEPEVFTWITKVRAALHVSTRIEEITFSRGEQGIEAKVVFSLIHFDPQLSKK